MLEERNRPLTINIRVIDIETDKEESEKQYQISKINVDMNKHRSYSAAKDDHDKQEAALNAKYKRIINLMIWAMNNKKELIIVNAVDDK